MTSRRLALLLSLAAFAAASRAQADLPPPDGRKYVSYEFRVQGLKAFPEQVLLAFPWSTSNGRPSEEHARIEDDKPLPVGRRSGAPRLYSMARADYESWLASYKPPSDNYEDPALRALFAGPKVHACDVAPTPAYELDADDERAKVVEVMRAVSVDGARCDLELVQASPTAGGLDTSRKTKVGGCAGCHAAPATGSIEGALALAVAALFARRRRARVAS